MYVGVHFEFNIKFYKHTLCYQNRETPSYKKNMTETENNLGKFTQNNLNWDLESHSFTSMLRPQ